MPSSTNEEQEMGTRNRVMALVVVGSVAAVLLPLATRSTSALFNSSASASASATTKRIFPGNRTVIAHTAKDASSGAEFDWSDQFATADGIYYTSSSWGTAYSPTNFIDVDFDAPNPAGIPTTAVSFNLTFADARGQSGDQLCYYFDVRRSSNPTTAIATYGGGSFVACEANSVLTPSTTSILSAVPNT